MKTPRVPPRPPRTIVHKPAAPSTVKPPVRSNREFALFAGNQSGKVDNLTFGSFTLGGLTDISGSVKNKNEDAFLIDGPVMVVADGMGDHGDGEKAALVVVETIASQTADSFNFRQAIAAASKRLVAEKRARRMNAEAGTTLVGLHFVPNTNSLQIAHLGDSRAYRFRTGLEILTLDHLWQMKEFINFELMMANPIIEQLGKDTETAWQTYQALTPPLSPERSRLFYQIATEHGKNGMVADTITKSLGGKGKDETPTILENLAWQPGDIYLLASDGLHDYIEFDPLAAVVAANRQQSPQAIAEAIQAELIDPHDNLTIGIVKC